jgi:hypothetical protein
MTLNSTTDELLAAILAEQREARAEQRALRAEIQGLRADLRHNRPFRRRRPFDAGAARWAGVAVG